MKFRPYIIAVACWLSVGLLSNANAKQSENQPATGKQSNAGLNLGDQLPEFELANFVGKQYSTQKQSSENGSAQTLIGKPLVVFFFGVECPIVKLYAAELPAATERFAKQGVNWIGIDSNQHDSLAEIAQFAKSTDLAESNMPLLKDPGNVVADQFGATRTPEVFLFDAAGRLQYRGAIDDRYSYGKQKPKPDQRYLLDAIDALLNDKPIPVARIEPVGCLIGKRHTPDETSEVTYANQISRLIQRRCEGCHRAGEVAPFALTDYEEVVGWAEMIEEVTQQRRMPPWHADPDHGHFKNDASLTQTELDQIKQWVAAGAPQGDLAELPKPQTFATGWQIGTPDAIVPMATKPFEVPATGVVPYQYFVVDPKFTEDKWVSAAECRIGNRAVVHHIIVATHDKGRRAAHGEIDSEWITATAPGSPPLVLPDGYAKLIPAGTKLLFQMHYTPNGTAQTDISSVGFKFVDPSTVKKIVGTRQAVNTDFRIPPRAENHEVKSRFKFRQDALMLSMFPHMHLRGKAFRYTVKYPDGKTEVLLDVPQYDFNWQNGYEFAEPKSMPAGTILECVAAFDNSENNLANPNPNKTVRWGDQTWDEMMIGYFNLAVDR